jgi:hypothetical protein
VKRLKRIVLSIVGIILSASMAFAAGQQGPPIGTIGPNSVGTSHIMNGSLAPVDLNSTNAVASSNCVSVASSTTTQFTYVQCQLQPSFTSGSIWFQGASGVAEDNANLFWDNTLKRLKITVPSGGSDTPMELIRNGGNSNLALTSYSGRAVYIGRSANGTLAAPTATVSGDSIYSVQAQGYNGTAFSSGTPSIQVLATETWTSIANGNKIVVATSATGSPRPSE